MRALAEPRTRTGMLLHVDGSRLANAAAALDCRCARSRPTSASTCVSFGGTKVGLLGGEAVVVLRPELADALPYLRKQSMQLASKMRFVAAQLVALLEDELWRRAAGHANAMAARLAAAVAGVDGVTVTQAVQANARLRDPARGRRRARCRSDGLLRLGRAHRRGALDVLVGHHARRTSTGSPRPSGLPWRAAPEPADGVRVGRRGAAGARDIARASYHDRPMAGRSLFVAMLILATVAAGCGSAAAPGGTTTTTVAEIAPVALSIEEPDGQTVPARVSDGMWVSDVTVSGHSQPGSLVRVTTGCRRPCVPAQRADRRGGTLAGAPARGDDPDHPYVRLVAELAGQSALSLVKLKPPAVGRKSTAKRGRTSSRSRKRRGSRTGGATAPSNREGTEGVPVPPPPATIPAPSAGGSPTQSPVTPGGSSGAASSVLVVGDSLAVGTQALLAARLPGWSVATDARKNRPLAEGMARWRHEKGNAVVNAFSLFTNDSPSNVAALESAVRETAAEGCAVWATIARPPQAGVSYAKANATLERLAAEMPGRVVVVPWAAAVADHPEWLIADKVHGTSAGYQARAQMYAQAAQSCV